MTPQKVPEVTGPITTTQLLTTHGQANCGFVAHDKRHPRQRLSFWERNVTGYDHDNDLDDNLETFDPRFSE
jgi:hypothetical protein